MEESSSFLSNNYLVYNFLMVLLWSGRCSLLSIFPHPFFFPFFSTYLSFSLSLTLSLADGCCGRRPAPSCGALRHSQSKHATLTTLKKAQESRRGEEMRLEEEEQRLEEQQGEKREKMIWNKRHPPFSCLKNATFSCISK